MPNETVSWSLVAMSQTIDIPYEVIHLAVVACADGAQPDGGRVIFVVWGWARRVELMMW